MSRLKAKITIQFLIDTWLEKQSVLGEGAAELAELETMIDDLVQFWDLENVLSDILIRFENMKIALRAQ